MADGIYSVVSGAVAETQRLEMLANNIANISTPGFKADHMAFKEVLAKLHGIPTRGTSSYVAPAEIRMDMSQGTMRSTENPLDLALEGKGYFAIKNGNETAFVRGGSFIIRQDGVLTDNDGRHLLQVGGQPINVGVSPGNLSIAENGTVYTQTGEVGRLQIVEFSNPSALKKLGNTLIAATPESAAKPATETRVRQGFLEASNANPIRGMTSMIMASRAYEAFHRVISTFNDIDKQAANKIGQD